MLNVEDRRQYERFPLGRPTRFISRTDLEASGRLIDISEGGMALAAPTSVDIGDELIAYPEGLGRLPGVVVRKFDGGVGVKFSLSDGQRANLAKRIKSAVTGTPYLRLFENRSSSRMTISLPAVAFIIGGGDGFECEISNLSADGAAVKSEVRPPLGSIVKIGTLQGRVCRHADTGFALEFHNRAAARMSA
ncbi:MAG: PilZ domain-containing protein [Pseudomonadota bacterium]|nr:PilZ domain-containing protein [Pseudomonadota bacterium]